MAITNFIPTIWSENLLESLDHKYVGVANCSREYEGEIKNKGSEVKICGVGKIDVGDYTKDTDLSSPQALTDTVKSLVINQAKCFNFQIDDIDRAQCTPKLMDAAMANAAAALAAEADRYVYSIIGNANETIIVEEVNADTVLDAIFNARRLLAENGVDGTQEIVLELPPAIATMLLRAKMALSTDNTAELETGCIGSIAGCKVFMTNSLEVVTTETNIVYSAVMRTRRAIAFAEQISEIDAYRPEKRFADAVKGLHLYGAKMVYPNEVVIFSFSVYIA